jgi:hypothetical protein
MPPSCPEKREANRRACPDLSRVSKGVSKARLREGSYLRVGSCRRPSLLRRKSTHRMSFRASTKADVSRPQRLYARKTEITRQSGVSLPGILIHLRCCLDSGQMNNIKTTFGGCFAIVAGFSPTNRARQRHWANGQIFSADHAGSMSQILACNRAYRYTVQTVITYLGTTKPRYRWCHTARRGFFL